MSFSGIAFGLPFTMNSVEGSEASLFVAAAATRSSWRRAMVAVGAAGITLVPIGALVWVIFRYAGANYVDYAIAAIVFLLGAREIREGLEERPAGRGQADSGVAGPSGVAPASAPSIRTFQRRHGVDPTGVIDGPTRVAIRAARAENGDGAGVDAYALGLDPADEKSIRAFQRRHGLEVTGDVDAATRGALRVAQQRGLVDPLDAGAVSRFQREHGLSATGEVDEHTAVAVLTARAEAGTEVEADEEGTEVRIDPVEAYRELDPAEPKTVEHLQRSLGLAPDGVIGDETRGALRALRARLRPDPGDLEEIRRLQARHDLPVTGMLDEATRKAAASHPADGAGGERTRGLLPDPLDAGSVRTFQVRFGLEGDGAIGPRTQEAIRYAREYLCGLDPTDTASVERFQRAHGLTADGVIGPKTQTAIRAVRSERVPEDDKARKERYGNLASLNGGSRVVDVDVADRDAVCAFQSSHHLQADGVIGPATREALVVARHERLDGGPLVGSHGEDSEESGPIARMKGVIGDAWPAYVGVTLESSEAILYSFAIASSSKSLLPAVLGAGAGFAWPWAALPFLRKMTDRVSEWKQETVIGIILVAVAFTFGLLHGLGVFA